MKIKRRNQKNVDRHCTQMLTDAERLAEKKSISKIEAYKKIEKHVYRRIEKERAADPERTINHESYEDDLDTKILELQSDLLEIEMKLVDALFSSSKLFVSRVLAIIEEMKTLNQDYIANVTNEVIQFNEKFREAALIEWEKFQAYAISIE